MVEILAMAAVTAGAFAATNLDNLVLLGAFYARYRGRSVAVTAGYFAGMILVAVICAVLGEAGEMIPIADLGMLGVIPILIGAYGLLQLFRGPEPDSGITGAGASQPLLVFVTLLTTQLGNSADSIITFSILLAESRDASEYVLAATFLGMTCLFAWLAYFSLSHRGLTRFMEKFGRYVTPVLLILVGYYIISDTATDMVIG